MCARLIYTRISCLHSGVRVVCIGHHERGWPRNESRMFEPYEDENCNVDSGDRKRISCSIFRTPRGRFNMRKLVISDVVVSIKGH